MIHAAENRWFKKIFYLYVRHYLLRRHFSQLQLKGEIDPPAVEWSRAYEYADDDLAARNILLGNEAPPVIYIANHSNWWDGLLAFDAYIPRSEYKHFIMMDEQQLRQFRFFTRAGAFSIDKSKSSTVMESLQYATNLLQERHAVWIFPQGEITHPEKRPLQFFSGVGYLLQQCPQAVVVPVTMYYSFCQRQKPEASLWFGKPISQPWADLQRKDISDYLSGQLQMQLDLHRDLYIEGRLGATNDEDRGSQETGFTTILRARTTDALFVSFNKWVKRWFMRWRA